MNDRPYRVTGAFLDESAHEGELLVDGARYRVTEADYRSLGFAEGDFLDESALEAVCTAAERLRCIRKAMDCLSYGDMSGKKLLGKLTGRFDRELALSLIHISSMPLPVIAETGQARSQRPQPQHSSAV